MEDIRNTGFGIHLKVETTKLVAGVNGGVRKKEKSFKFPKFWPLELRKWR